MMVGYNFYAKNDENDGWQHNALASFWHNFTRETRLDLNNAFLYTQDPLGDQDVVNQQGTVVAPGDYTQANGVEHLLPELFHRPADPPVRP